MDAIKMLVDTIIPTMIAKHKTLDGRVAALEKKVEELIAVTAKKPRARKKKEEPETPQLVDDTTMTVESRDV